MKDSRFKGKVAIVTGAGQGIGEAYARRLAAEGAAVVVAEINAKKGEEVAASIRDAGGAAIFARTDVSDEASALSAAKSAFDAFGGIDFLVNNAAIYGELTRKSWMEVDLDYYRKFMQVTLDGALLMSRAVHPFMVARGGGAIVNQSSAAAWNLNGYYGVAKLGINGLTISLAREFGPQNIRVNAVSPGPVATESTVATVNSASLAALVGKMPLSRMGTAEDIANTCLFLLSDEASWVTGQIWCVDGGAILKPA